MLCHNVYDYLSVNRDKFVNALKEINIGTSVLFMPLHLHSYYVKLLNHRLGDFPIAENLFERVICLPLSPALSEADIRKVSEGVLCLLERFKR